MVELVLAFVDLCLAEGREGQGLVEYALILVLISIAVIATMALMGGQVGDVFGRMAASLQ